MDFDNATNTFSNRVEIFRDATLFPGWPFFTPDGLEVIFALGNGSDYATIQDPPTGLIRQSQQLDDRRASGTRTRDLSISPTARHFRCVIKISIITPP